MRKVRLTLLVLLVVLSFGTRMVVRAQCTFSERSSRVLPPAFSKPSPTRQRAHNQVTNLRPTTRPVICSRSARLVRIRPSSYTVVYLDSSHPRPPPSH
jgi:hypothetical protein